MTLPHQRERPADFPQSTRYRLGMGLAIGCVATGVFASGVFARFFEDEYAYISQSYYADLFFQGRFQDPAWLEYPAYDLPPLPKYLIAIALHLDQLPMPRPEAAWAWYAHYGHFGIPTTLWVARLPMIIAGAMGCIAIFGLGVLVKDARMGIAAAVALMLNPLYRLHAHRAMSDVPSEAFLLVALALFLWWSRRIWAGRHGVAFLTLPGLAGIAAGFALLSKFSGLLGLIIVAAWTSLALVAPRLELGRKLTIAGGAIGTMIVAFAVFVGFNPFMTAQPSGPLPRESRSLAGQSVWQRFDFQVRHRLAVSENQKLSFPHNALHGLADKARVFAVQGFGRFGPFGPSESDSTVRFELRQDWGATLWLPLVVFGLVASLRLGMTQFRAGQPPTALALAAWAALAWAVVLVYLPMAWDRYLLPIQSGNSLLIAVAVTAAWDRIGRRGWVLETRS
jgi:4-amino-4-deoxy-L-arabinose transferase-like glycosyltransferase